MRHFFATTLFFTLISSAFGQSGRIYIDKNNNNIFDSPDVGISKVAVSNGEDVVLSDKDGKFSIHKKDNRFIFITTPSGYEVVGDFYAELQNAKNSYDFILKPIKRHQKDGSHNFVHITDTEIFNTDNHSDWVNGIKDFAKNEQAAFIIHTGDICYEKGLNSHRKLMNDINMGLPVRYCIGNHDYVDGKYGEEIFENNFGPTYYSFEVGNIHYLVTPMPHGDRKPGFDPQKLIQWIKNDLSVKDPQKKVVVFNHDLLNKGDKFAYKNGENELDLNNLGLIAWVYGHWHINHVKMVGNVMAITTSSPDKGGIDHSVGAFRKISIDKNDGVSSHLIYPYLHKTITVCRADVKDNLLFLSVNGYNTASPIESIIATVLQNNNPITKPIKLNKSSDWNFNNISELSRFTTDISVRFVIQFKNGSKSEVVQNVVVNNAQPVEIKDNWTNHLNDANHNGIVESNLNSDLILSWSVNIGSNIYMSSPIIYDSVVYIACVDESHSGKAKLVAYNCANGDKLWEYKVRNSIKNSIATTGGLIFAQDAEGYLYAVDSKKGTLKWEYRLPVNGLPSIIEGLVAKDGIVYAGTGKGLTALNTDGKVLWTNIDWQQHEGATSTLSLSEDILLSGSQWQALFANDAKTGKLLWSLKKHGVSNRGATPVIIKNLAYFISDKSFFIVDIISGKILIRKELPVKVDVTSTPLILDDIIVFGTSNDGIMALDRETLEQKWNYDTKPSLIFTAPYTRYPAATIETSPVLSNGLILCGASDGVLRAFDINGTLLWSYDCGAPILSTPAISGNAIFTTDYSGNLNCFTPKSRF